MDAPEFIESPSPTTAYIRLSCASEEYGIGLYNKFLPFSGSVFNKLILGPINHYWLIVVPTNYSKDDLLNVDSAQLQRSTHRFRASRTMNSSTISSLEHHQKGVKKSSSSPNRRALSTRQTPAIARPLDDVYISAQLSSHQMQRLYRDERSFTLGDGRVSFL